MDFQLTPEQRDLQQLVRDISQKEIKPLVDRWDRTHAFPWESIRALGAAGVLGLTIPEEYGGIGGSWFRLNGALKIEWQRDFFDFGHVSYMFGQLIGSGDLSEGMQKRIERSLAGEKLPGYYPLGEAPVPIW